MTQFECSASVCELKKKLLFCLKRLCCQLPMWLLFLNNLKKTCCIEKRLRCVRLSMRPPETQNNLDGDLLMTEQSNTTADKPITKCSSCSMTSSLMTCEPPEVVRLLRLPNARMIRFTVIQPQDSCSSRVFVGCWFSVFNTELPTYFVSGRPDRVQGRVDSHFQQERRSALPFRILQRHPASPQRAVARRLAGRSPHGRWRGRDFDLLENRLPEW